MRMYDLIKKKRDGYSLSTKEIEFIVNGYVKGDIADYQMAAFLMAVFFRGLDERETYDLTMSMKNSGDTVDLSQIEGFKVDKHSTGGVGDKTTLVVLPIVASYGVRIAKMSGRALGHTGGTIDKLESIPGLRTDLSEKEFLDVVNRAGFSIVGQTKNLVPADKKIYALRDATATVDQISLIAASIVSKKLAGGADGIVFDVKTGSGAFLKTLEESRKLASVMIKTVARSSKKAVAVISNMDQPLGNMVGNALEVFEAIQCLKGNGPEDLTELSVTLAHEMLNLAGINVSSEEIRDRIASGKPLEKFKSFVALQGGDISYVENPDKLLSNSKVFELRANEDGFVESINSELIGIASMVLGGGRLRKEDTIDHSVGIQVVKKIGDRVKPEDVLVRLYTSDKSDKIYAEKLIREAYVIGSRKPNTTPVVLEVIR